MGREFTKHYNCGSFGRKVLRNQWKKWQKEKGYNKRYRGENPRATWEYHSQFTWLAFLAN